ncbi:MAG: PD40 domain-containing protein [Anaerolineae bacterium]|nr:PD40 domain-containing protein [Anaerolineae bacterium]
MNMRSKLIPIFVMISLSALILGRVTAQAPSTDVPSGELVFLRQIDSNWHVVRANTDGSDLQVLYAPDLDHGEGPSAPLWSPNGQKILFSVNYYPQRSKPETVRQYLYLIDADGSNLIKVGDFERSSTTFVLNHYVYGGWSPDSQAFIYGYYQTESDGSTRTEFFKVDLKGKSLSLNPKPAPSYKSVLYMPGGKLIILDQEGILTIENGERSVPKVIKADAEINFLYDISADGKYALCLLNKSFTFGVLNIDTGRFRSLREISDGMVVYEARWSPEGNHFLVQGTPKSDVGVAWVTAVVETESGQITTLEEGPGFLYGRVDWSADGAYLIFENNKEGGSALYLSRPDGSEKTKLMAGAHAHWRPEPKGKAAP